MKKTKEHVMLHFQKYEDERRHLIQNLQKIKVQFNVLFFKRTQMSVSKSHFSIFSQTNVIEKI